jgi:Fe(3+) dicitrate transport protein
MDSGYSLLIMIINKTISRPYFSLALVTLGMGLTPLASAEEGLTLPEIEVSSEREAWRQALSPIPSETGATQLKKGKKITFLQQEAAPVAPVNNYRYQFARSPGILVSEVNNESFASMSIRGLGDPHESQNLLLLADGIPLAADMYGYGANYFQPPMEWVESTEIIRGGAALFFGPLPGGAVAYRLRSPQWGKKFGLSSGFRWGSFQTNTFSLGIQVPASEAGAGLLNVQRRMSAGFRTANSDYDVSNVRAKWAQKLRSGESLSVTLEGYRTTHGEPGGLASPFGDRSLSTTPNDRLEISRTFGSIEYRNERDPGLVFTSTLFGGRIDRNSFRQNLGTATQFGGTPNAPTNTIQKQGFLSLANDSRVKWNHAFLSEKNTLSASFLLYAVDSPFIQEQGSSVDARSGTAQKNLDRKTRTLSLALEERFSWGETSITPGLRLENIYQSIRENLNSGATVDLRNSSEWVHVPLFGLGVETRISPRHEVYANLSQSYRPTAFQDTIPLQNGDLISEDLRPAKAWTLEAGLRDRWSEKWTWDVSAFLISYSDQFGRDGNILRNTGAAIHQGLEASSDLELLRGKIDLHWVGNLTGLHARFKEGPFSGKTPQYAPKWMIKNGLYSNLGNQAKIALSHTWVTEHFGDDGNNANRKIPTYRVLDLTLEGRIPGTGLRLFAGMFNLLDESYHSRVRSNGIEPAMPRNFSIGLSAGI